MRASDQDRDRAVRLLRHHNMSGRLSTEEFERRLEVALSAETTDQLAVVARDLPTSGHQPISGGPAARVGLFGIRPFLVETMASGEPDVIRATALRTLGHGLIGSGFELVYESPTALEFAPVARRGWFRRDRERVVMSFASHRNHATAILIYGRASRKVRKLFARLP